MYVESVHGVKLWRDLSDGYKTDFCLIYLVIQIWREKA